MMMFSTRRKLAAGRGERGFSLLELLAALTVIMIVSGMAMPLVANAYKQWRLTEAGIDFANLLQQARVRSVQDDKSYSVETAVDANGMPFAYIDLNGTNAYQAGDPAVYFASNVIVQPFGAGPALANLEGQFLPAGTNYAVVVPAGSQATPTFSSRGLPCDPNNLVNGACSAVGQPTAYVAFFQSLANNVWAAVTVTPAGRIREWSCSDGATWVARN